MSEFKNQKEVGIVKEVLTSLFQKHKIQSFHGRCIAACEILEALLIAKNLRVRTLECTLVVVNSKSNAKGITLVGFDAIEELGSDSTDTHLVVLVEADTPFIVDTSIGHLVGAESQIILTPLTNTDPDVIATCEFGETVLTYRVKKNIKLTSLHQKSLLERVIEDQKTRKEVLNVRKLAWIAVYLSAFNVSANVLLLVLKALFP